MRVRVPEQFFLGTSAQLVEVRVRDLDTIVSPCSPSPGQGMLRHLLEDHHRSAVELMPCSERLEQVHRFEHFEAGYGLVVVDHLHPDEPSTAVTRPSGSS